MKWTLKDQRGNEIMGVYSFRMEQAKGKPATLSWMMGGTPSISSDEVTLWRGEKCLFKGRKYPHPTKISNMDYSWIAVAIDDTFQQQKHELLLTLNTGLQLSGNITDCEGAKPGFIHIHPVTHQVRWVSLEHPECVWESHDLHERDSLQVNPIDQELKGLSSTVTLKAQRIASGMMDVGPFIAGLFPHGIETYSGAALEEQWGHFAFRALRAGYDIHAAELIPKAYRRVDLPKRLTFVTQKDEVVSIAYQAYAVKLLLGWALPVTTHTTVSITTEHPDEAIVLSLKDESDVNESALITEMIHWMKTYATLRSFTAQVKYRILVTDDIEISSLGVGAWSVLNDPRVHEAPIIGPIVGYVMTNEGGITWAEITQLWAPKPPLHLNDAAQLHETLGDSVALCQTPQDIIASIRVLNGAEEQYAYHLRHTSTPIETIVKDFPMTHIEIGLNPLASSPVEHFERKYRVGS